MTIDSNTVGIWDVETGAMTGQPMAHRSELRAAVFSPDDKLIVTMAYDGTAQLWDAATHQKTGPVFKKWNRGICAEFSPDGTRLLLGGYPDSSEKDVGGA